MWFLDNAINKVKSFFTSPEERATEQATDLAQSAAIRVADPVAARAADVALNAAPRQTTTVRTDSVLAPTVEMPTVQIEQPAPLQVIPDFQLGETILKSKWAYILASMRQLSKTSVSNCRLYSL